MRSFNPGIRTIIDIHWQASKVMVDRTLVLWINFIFQIWQPQQLYRNNNKADWRIKKFYHFCWHESGWSLQRKYKMRTCYWIKENKDNPRKFKIHTILDLLWLWQAVDITKNQIWQSIFLTLEANSIYMATICVLGTFVYMLTQLILTTIIILSL